MFQYLFLYNIVMFLNISLIINTSFGQIQLNGLKTVRSVVETII